MEVAKGVGDKLTSEILVERMVECEKSWDLIESLDIESAERIEKERMRV